MHPKHNWLIIMALSNFFFTSCSNQVTHRTDLINNPFPQAQKELREVVETIARDAETANIQGLQAIHLQNPKFTKFGPRKFKRQDVASTNKSEADHFGSIFNFKQEIRELKIDVFGNIGIATYYPYVSFEKNGKKINADGRQTLVFLKTEEGWKIIHEHGTVRKE